MKLKRLLPILALGLCAVMLLTACGGGIGFEKDAVNASYEKDNITAQALEGFEEYTILGNEGGVILMSKPDGTSTVYRVYNLTKNADVRTVTYTSDAIANLTTKGHPIPVSLNDDGITEIITAEGDELRYTYLTPSAQVIKEASDKRAVYKNDCVQIGTTVYRLDPMTIDVKESFERSELLGEIPECDFFADKYYYIEDGRKIISYDDEYNYLASYTVPEYADDYDFYCFVDGYVVIQYTYEVDPMEDDYDLYVDSGMSTASGMKYNLVTLRFNPKSGKTTELKTDYYLENAVPVQKEYASKLMDGLYGDKDITLVTAYEITDQRLRDSSENRMTMLLNSKLAGDRINFYEDTNVSTVHYGGGYIVYRATDSSGRLWVFNAKGKLIAENIQASNFTEKYIITADAIYDYELNKLTDIKASGESDELEYYGQLGSKLVFRTADQTRFYLFDGSAAEKFTLMGDAGDLDFTNISDSFFGKRDAEGKYTYYSAAGTVLFTSEIRVSVSVTGEDCVLVTAYTASGKVFYRLEQ